MEEITGRNLFEVFPDNPDDPTADGVSNLHASLNSVLKNKVAHTMAVQKYDVRKHDGTFEEKYWSPLNTPVLNSDNEVEYIIHKVEDVTEFIKIKNEQVKKDKLTEELVTKVEKMEADIFSRAQEIQRLNDSLERKIEERTEANKELEAFSYTVSHDLRAPIRAISGYAKILEEDFGERLGDEGKRRIDVITANAKNMGVLIDDLLTFSRLGRKELIKSDVDMTSLAKDSLNEVCKSVNHSASVKINDLHPAKADASLMQQVFINLISNAIKYSAKKDNPVIEVKSEEKGSKIIYSVKDNGAGFDMQYVHKIFGIFERLHSIEDFEGTGVGLAIVNRIVTKHNGEVWAEGKPDEGAEFYFSLPKSMLK
jgi:light-regulated signal transduction histidine kinase (bacteriophytochrome)